MFSVFSLDQDEIVKMATEGDLIRNVAGQRASAGAEEVHYAEEVTTRTHDDNAGPQVSRKNPIPRC